MFDVHLGAAPFSPYHQQASHPLHWPFWTLVTPFYDNWSRSKFSNFSFLTYAFGGHPCVPFSGLFFFSTRALLIRISPLLVGGRDFPLNSAPTRPPFFTTLPSLLSLAGDSCPLTGLLV